MLLLLNRSFLAPCLQPQWLTLIIIILKAIIAFDAETDKELSLAVGDFVVVRKVWSFSLLSHLTLHHALMGACLVH